MRWPNDVVERGGTGRKIAGVLIERWEGLWLIGIGINVTQGEGDFDPHLRGRAASVRMLGGRATRAEVAGALLAALDRRLGLAPALLAAEWRGLEVLTGTRRAFEHDGKRYEGLVVGIDPLHHIEVQADDGSVVRLPALTTSMVHPE
jgi:biotin-(acetyl-CoA carboxylase) ligase